MSIKLNEMYSVLLETKSSKHKAIKELAGKMGGSWGSFVRKIYKRNFERDRFYAEQDFFNSYSNRESST